MTREDVVNRLKEIENDFESYMGTLDGEALTNAGTFIACQLPSLSRILMALFTSELVTQRLPALSSAG